MNGIKENLVNINELLKNLILKKIATLLKKKDLGALNRVSVPACVQVYVFIGNMYMYITIHL